MNVLRKSIKLFILTAQLTKKHHDWEQILRRKNVGRSVIITKGLTNPSFIFPNVWMFNT